MENHAAVKEGPPISKDAKRLTIAHGNWKFFEPEATNRFDDPCAEEVFPESIGDHQRRQRIASKISMANPSGSMLTWQVAQRVLEVARFPMPLFVRLEAA